MGIQWHDRLVSPPSRVSPSLTFSREVFLSSKWNALSKTDRGHLLEFIGRSPNFKHRVWGFIPKSVREDLEFGMQRLGLV